VLASTALAALDRLTTGLLILDREGRAVHVNPAADAILQGRDGLVLRNGVPQVLRAAEDRRLRGLIAGIQCRTGPAAGGRMFISRPSGRTAYAVAVTPAGHGLSSPLTDRTRQSASVLVFIADPEQRSTRTPESLEARFGFPPAEARLVHALVGGQSLPDYARTVGISYNTAKTQLARALSRTSTNSQLGLLRLVYSTDLGIETG
jgi:DNA-binding CsgD family transcriptional regulator